MSITPTLMKRCPRVMLRLGRPSTSPAMVRPSCIRIRPCTGRTNCASPSPQRISLATGSFFSAASTMPARYSSMRPPVFLMRATKYSALPSLSFSSCANSTPAERMKPSSALVAVPSAPTPAATAGPFLSITRSGWLSRQSSNCSARRRGVAYQRPALAASMKPASASAFCNCSRKDRPSFASDFGGSSSVRSSIKRVAFMPQLPCTSGSRAARANRGRPARSRAPGRARGRCRRRAR